MAFYNPYYPQPQFFNPTPQSYQQPVQQQSVVQQPQSVVPQQTQPTIQNTGLISVPNEDTARNYPVGPGNSVTFKDENAPYVYTKTMGFSQLDRPIFEKYRLVREEDTTAQPETITPTTNKDLTELQEKFNTLRGIVDELRGDVDVLMEHTTQQTVKKNDTDGGH